MRGLLTETAHLASAIVSTGMHYFRTGVTSKEQRNQKMPPTRRVWEGSKEMPPVLPDYQNCPCWNPSWPNNVCTIRKDTESEWLARNKLETNPITIKIWDWTTWQSSPLASHYPLFSTLGSPSPIVSCQLWWGLFAVVDIHSHWGTQEPACPLMNQTPWPQLGLLKWTDQNAPTGQGTRDFIWPLSFPLWFFFLAPPILQFFLSPGFGLRNLVKESQPELRV